MKLPEGFGTVFPYMFVNRVTDYSAFLVGHLAQ